MKQNFKQKIVQKFLTGYQPDSTIDAEYFTKKSWKEGVLLNNLEYQLEDSRTYLTGYTT